MAVESGGSAGGGRELQPATAPDGGEKQQAKEERLGRLDNDDMPQRAVFAEQAASRPVRLLQVGAAARGSGCGPGQWYRGHNKCLTKLCGS